MEESSFNKDSLFTTVMMRVDLNLMSDHFKKILALLCDVLNHSNFSFSGQPCKLVARFAYLSVIDKYTHRVLLFYSTSYSKHRFPF